jgi:hypothetical protein
LALVLIFWALNWGLKGLRTHWGFTGLWVGYCLLVDGLVYARKGTSLAARSWRAYLWLFFLSSWGWWLFELINLRTQNWWYHGKELFTQTEYFLLASLSFSTVMPAVFGTAELVSTLPFIQRAKPGPLIKPKRPTLWTFFLSGWVMLGLMLAWPRYFFPFVWLSLYFILAPVNAWLGHRNLAERTARGDWRPVYALWLGTLVCGFFWEMWNFYSYPKWIYEVPFVDFWHVFEMPLLGYGGYLPFGLELFALFHLVSGVLKWKNLQDYIEI